MAITKRNLNCFIVFVFVFVLKIVTELFYSILLIMFRAYFSCKAAKKKPRKAGKKTSTNNLLIAHCLLSRAYFSRKAAKENHAKPQRKYPQIICLLLIAYCVLPIAHCSLPIAYCSLPIAHCVSLNKEQKVQECDARMHN